MKCYQDKRRPKLVSRDWNIYKQISASPSTREKEPLSAIFSPSGAWMQGLHSFKRAAKDTKWDRSVVSDATNNLMDDKEIKWNSGIKGICNIITLYRALKHQAIILSHVMKRQKLEHVVAIKIIEGKCYMGMLWQMMLNWLTDIIGCRNSDRCVKSDRKLTLSLRTIEIWTDFGQQI